MGGGRQRRKRAAAPSTWKSTAVSALKKCEKTILTCSPMHDDRCHGHRHWHDMLVLSNMIFVAAAIVSFLVNQWVCGILQLMAAICSTVYHRMHERHALLLAADAVVSGTLSIIACWATFHSFTKFPAFAVLAICMLLSCAFLMVYCDLPGHPRYEFWHLMWHLNSGIGTMAISIFLAHYFPQFDMLLMTSFM